MYKYSKIRFSKLCVYSLIVTCLIYEHTKVNGGGVMMAKMFVINFLFEI